VAARAARELPLTARAGTLLHALAGDDAAADGERGMVASDLLPAAPLGEPDAELRLFVPRSRSRTRRRRRRRAGAAELRPLLIGIARRSRQR
jgi:hypothetical protein